MKKPATYRSKLSSPPIVPAGKLYTTPTMLSSGEALKKTNFVGIMWNSSPVIASPFAPGGSLPFPANCLLPTAYCHCHCHFLPSLSFLFAPFASLRFSFFFFAPAVLVHRSPRQALAI